MRRMPLSELKAPLDSERNEALAATRVSKLSVECARREVARRTGRGRTHLRRAGRVGCGVFAQDRVSEGRGGMSEQPEAVRKAIGDAYDDGHARGVKAGATLMRDYLIAQLAPLTLEQEHFFRDIREAGEVLGQVEAS
jgi:hypothetical protein